MNNKKSKAHGLWVIEWATWIIAISASTHVWFAGAEPIQTLKLSLIALAGWGGACIFTLACIRLADSLGSPRAAIRKLANAFRRKNKGN